MYVYIYIYIYIFIHYLYLCAYRQFGLQELIDKILQLEAHNEQLRALITKTTDSKSEKKEMPDRVRKSFDFSR